MKAYYKNKNGKEVEFTIIRSNRKTISIEVKPNKDICVKAPVRLSNTEIVDWVNGKSSWIESKLDKIDKTGYREKEYIEGEEYLYLGDKYRLKIIGESNRKVPELRCEKDKLLLHIDKEDLGNKETIRKNLVKWYKIRAKEVIGERIDLYQDFFDSRVSELKVVEKNRSWASCTWERKLLFSWRCVMMPYRLLDYIVVHEMSHMVEMNHSKRFWNHVESIMPDYRERRDHLKESGIIYRL